MSAQKTLPGGLPVRCTDCGRICGVTDCEITATSMTHCENCYDEYIAEHYARRAEEKRREPK